MRFKNKVAFITGGGTGIGAATAKRFVAEGGQVVLMGRRREPLEAVAQPLGGLVVAGDAANAQDVQRALEQAKAMFGHVDVLIANAGGHGIGTALETNDDAWSVATRLNLDTAFVCARELMNELIDNAGNIVVVSSIAGLFAGPGAIGYVTMKHALIGLTRSLARDYGALGVRVNALCPGWVSTDMADQQMQALAEKQQLSSITQAYALVTKDTPLRRPATADEIAGPILFLASADAAMVTGTYFTVDGGASCVDLPTLAFV